MKYIAGALCALFLAGAVQADENGFVSGNTLLSRLQSSSTNDRVFGLGYVAAVADAFDGESFCIPAGVNVRQMADVTLRMLEARPEMRHFTGAAFVTAALMQTFPCNKKKLGGTL